MKKNDTVTGSPPSPRGVPGIGLRRRGDPGVVARERPIRKTFLVLRLLGLLGALGIVLWGTGSDAELRKVTLTLHWYPQTQFAGYYMAREKGFYLRRGIDLEIRRGGADVDGARELREGRTDFATMFLTGALRFRTADLPLVNVGQIVNRGNTLIVAKKKNRILAVGDLDKRRMSLWGDVFSGAYKQLFAARKIWPVVVPQYFSVELFLRGAVDACCAMTYNEYIRILQAGYRPEELTVVSLRDEGCDFPEDGIYCLAPTWRQDPELCRNVLEASLEGWRYASRHPEETVALVQRLADGAGYTVNPLLLRHMLQAILPSIFPEAPGETWIPGTLSRQDYERTAAMMSQVFVLSGGNAPYEDFVPYGADPTWGKNLRGVEVPREGEPPHAP